MCRYLIFFITLCVSLTSCTVGPKYVPPEMEVQCEWNGEHSKELEEESVECYSWWQSLNDPILTSLLERAAIQNLDLQLAIARVVEARLALKGGEAAFLPHVDGSVSYSYLTYNQKTLNDVLGFGNCCKGSRQRQLNIFEAGFDAEWEIDLFGMNAHQNNALEAMAISAQESYSLAWVTLSAEIARSYVELRGLQQRLVILNRDIESQQDTQELIKSLTTAGFSGSIDQMQAEGELNLMISQKPQIELLIYKSMHHLSILLGGFPADLYCELSMPEPIPDLPCYRPIGIPSELLRRRPDIRKAERDLAAATEEVGSAIAALFPRISLRGFIGDIAALCSSGSLTGFICPQLLFPVFNSKLLQQDVCVNKIKVEQALLQYQQTVLLAFEETENAIAAFHYELKKKQSLDQAEYLTQNSYLLTLQLYQNGLKNYLDVQTAHRSLLAAKKASLQGKIDLIVNYIVLYKALGGRWHE